MDQLKEHIRLLSIFHYVVGGMMALVSFFPVIHLVMGLAMLMGFIPGDIPEPDKDTVNSDINPELPLRIMGGIFTGVAAIVILTGLTISFFVIRAGKKLSRYESRTFCIVMAAILCAFAPFGTVLGIFSIIVLTKPEAQELFGDTPSSPALPPT